MRYHRTFFTLCALALSFATAAEPAATDELYVCTYGRSKFPENYAFQDGRKDASVDLAWSFYVARSGTDVTLIDTGFSSPALAKQWYVTHTRTPAELLADLKITPDQVTRILITHIHFDHLCDLPLYPRAQVFISRRSRDDYLSGKPLGGVMFDPQITAILKDPARTHVIEERELLPGGLDFEVIGGHTAGSAVVHLQHQGVHHVLAGDECYLCANATRSAPSAAPSILRAISPSSTAWQIPPLSSSPVTTSPCSRAFPP